MPVKKLVSKEALHITTKVLQLMKESAVAEEHFLKVSYSDLLLSKGENNAG